MTSTRCAWSSTSPLDVSGYDAANWLREHQRVDMGLSDHYRIKATLSVADDDQTATRLISALRALTNHAADLPEPSRSRYPRRAHHH